MCTSYTIRLSLVHTHSTHMLENTNRCNRALVWLAKCHDQSKLLLFRPPVASEKREDAINRDQTQVEVSASPASLLFFFSFFLLPIHSPSLCLFCCLGNSYRWRPGVGGEQKKSVVLKEYDYWVTVFMHFWQLVCEHGCIDALIDMIAYCH